MKVVVRMDESQEFTSYPLSYEKAVTRYCDITVFSHKAQGEGDDAARLAAIEHFERGDFLKEYWRFHTKYSATIPEQTISQNLLL